MANRSYKRENLDEAILVTLSQKTIKERRGGFRQILTEWYDSNGEDKTWWYKLGNMPKQQPIWIYWVVGGRIRYRCKLADIRGDMTIQFATHSKPLHGKAWLICFDFEAIPKRDQQVIKGFQGFRYFDPVLGF